jgi:hypothetical protein
MELWELAFWLPRLSIGLGIGLIAVMVKRVLEFTAEKRGWIRQPKEVPEGKEEQEEVKKPGSKKMIEWSLILTLGIVFTLTVFGINSCEDEPTPRKSAAVARAAAKGVASFPDRLIVFFIIAALVAIGFTAWESRKAKRLVAPPMWTLAVIGLILIHSLIWWISPGYWTTVLSPWLVFLGLILAAFIATSLLSSRGAFRWIGAAVLVLALIFLSKKTGEYHKNTPSFATAARAKSAFKPVCPTPPDTLIPEPGVWSREIKAPSGCRINAWRDPESLLPGDTLPAMDIRAQDGREYTIPKGPVTSYLEIPNLHTAQFRLERYAVIKYEFLPKI